VFVNVARGSFPAALVACFSGAYDWPRTGSHRFVTDTLREEALLEDFLCMDAVRKVVADHMAGKINDYSKVCILLTLALWRKHIWGQ